MGTVLDAVQTAATLLNDAGMSNFDFTALMKFMPKAHRDLQLDLVLNGLSVVRDQAALITVTAGSLDLGANQPTNLIVPIELSERQAGSSDLFDPMFQREWEPDLDPSPELIYWIWRNELIKFLGATTDRQVRLRYTGGLTIPTKEGDSLGFILAECYLGPKIAALAAASIGAAGSLTAWTADSEKQLEKVVAINVKQQQSLPARRRSYRSRRTRLWV